MHQESAHVIKAVVSAILLAAVLWWTPIPASAARSPALASHWPSVTRRSLAGIGRPRALLQSGTAPVLTDTDLSMPSIVEDLSNDSNGGILVSDLLGTSAYGIAITSRDLAIGHWNFWDGYDWWDVDRSGTPSDANAMLLPPEAYIRFVPGADANGTAAFTFRAWDQTSGAAYYGADASNNGGNTAFSSQVGTVTIEVTPVNDAPSLICEPTHALAFDGTDDYVTLPDSGLSGDFTVEAWVKPTNHQTWARIVDLGNGPESDNLILSFYRYFGYPTLDTWLGNDNGSGSYVTDWTWLPVDTWSHVAGVNDGQGTGYVYVNGELRASGYQVVPRLIARLKNYIGHSNWAQDSDFKGQMREIRLWDYDRSEAEIQQDMYQTLTGREAGLAAYYRADESSGSTLHDYSGHYRDGTLVNHAGWAPIGQDVFCSDTVDQEVASPLNGLQVTDVDAGTGDETVTFNVTHGTLTARTDVAGGLAASDIAGNGTANLTFLATLTATNATLAAENGLTYLGTTGYSGADILAVTMIDNGNSGGGSQTTNASVHITVMPTNHPPVISQGATTTVTIDEDEQPQAFALSLDASDADGDLLSWSLLAPPSHGTASASGISPSVDVEYTPTADYNGTDSFAVRVKDGFGGTDAITVGVTILPVDDPPVLTASAASPSFIEGGAAVAIDPGLTLTDVDGCTLDGATVSITGNFVRGEDWLDYTTTGPITGTYDSSTGILTLGGSGDAAACQAALRAVKYRNTSENPSTASRTIGFLQITAFKTLSVVAVNDAPVLTVPAAQTVATGNALAFGPAGANRVSVSDVDVAAGDLSVALTTTHGALTLAGVDGLELTAGDGEDDAHMRFTGVITAVNAGLNGMHFDPATGYIGPASLQVAVADQGNTGSGGSLAASATASITVGAAAATAFSAQMPPGGTYGTAYEGYTFLANGVPAPTYGVVTGTLPPGLSLAASGVLSGTLSSAGSYAGIVVRATNAGGVLDSAPFTITIARAALTVTADSKSRYFDEANPPLTASYTGFANNDTAASALSGAPDLTTTAIAGSPLGAYAIHAASGSLAASEGNYRFAYIDGALTVADRPIVGLSATSNGPVLLGDRVDLSAEVTSGTHVTYRWDFEDGTAVVSGAAAGHVYAATGTYRATVTATNAAGSQSASTDVVVQPAGARVVYVPLVMDGYHPTLSLTQRMYLPIALCSVQTARGSDRFATERSIGDGASPAGE